MAVQNRSDSRSCRSPSTSWPGCPCLPSQARPDSGNPAVCDSACSPQPPSLSPPADAGFFASPGTGPGQVRSSPPSNGSYSWPPLAEQQLSTVATTTSPTPGSETRRTPDATAGPSLPTINSGKRNGPPTPSADPYARSRLGHCRGAGAGAGVGRGKIPPSRLSRLNTVRTSVVKAWSWPRCWVRRE